MKTKILLPVLAIVFAVGLAFATVDTDLEGPFIQLEDGSWLEITPVCNGVEFECKVQLEENGTHYTVYPIKSTSSTPLRSSSENPYKLY